MKPVLFSIGSVEISAFALMLSIGAGLGFLLTAREARRRGLDQASMLTVAVVAFAAGLIGARWLSLALQRTPGSKLSFWSVLTFADPAGESLYGALGLASLAGLAAIVLQRLPYLKAADALVLAWVPSIAIVRIGCFLNGCCYGRPTTASLGLVGGGGPNAAAFGIRSHPVQLYAATAALLIYTILRALDSRRRDGEVMAAFLVLFAAFVFAHEFLRGDPRPAWRFAGLGVLSLNQIVSLPLAVAALAGWAVLSLRRRYQTFLRRRRPTIAPTARNSGTE